MTRQQEAEKLGKFIRKTTKELAKDPEKARAYLVRLGILDKSGKKLSRKYGG
jgi:hypothetical protein